MSTPTNGNQDIPASLTILDAASRDSWCLVKISAPELGIEIEDWFHLSTPDQEHIATDYAFTPKESCFDFSVSI